jgi:hypothetical protein
MPIRYPGPNEKYPGKKDNRCLGCGWPIDSNGDCGCGWNHFTKRSSFNDHAHIFLNTVKPVDPTPPAKKDPDKDNKE